MGISTAFDGKLDSQARHLRWKNHPKFTTYPKIPADQPIGIYNVFKINPKVD